MASELIDFSASRRTRTRTAANVRAVMDEAAQMQDRVNAAVMKAQLAALANIDTSSFIAEAQAEVAKLASHLNFAAALQERLDMSTARAAQR